MQQFDDLPFEINIQDGLFHNLLRRTRLIIIVKFAAVSGTQQHPTLNIWAKTHHTTTKFIIIAGI